jgi:hypothetical protein
MCRAVIRRSQTIMGGCESKGQAQTIGRLRELDDCPTDAKAPASPKTSPQAVAPLPKDNPIP